MPLQPPCSWHPRTSQRCLWSCHFWFRARGGGGGLLVTPLMTSKSSYGLRGPPRLPPGATLPASSLILLLRSRVTRCFCFQPQPVPRLPALFKLPLCTWDAPTPWLGVQPQEPCPLVANSPQQKGCSRDQGLAVPPDPHERCEPPNSVLVTLLRSSSPSPIQWA